MLISELSRRSGVSIATIKYYLREGLLPTGEATAATRAEYDDRHLGRLRLIRALVEVGKLSLATIRRILEAVDNEDLDLHDLLGTAHYALGPTVEPPSDDEEWQKVNAQVEAFLADLGWRVTPFAPARRMLSQALVTLRHLGLPTGAQQLWPYARAAEALARAEIEGIDTSVPRTAMVERVVVATVLYEPVLIALRRLAQEHQSALRFGLRP